MEVYVFAIIFPNEFFTVNIIYLTYVGHIVLQTKGRVHDDDTIEKMLHDLSLIKKFE